MEWCINTEPISDFLIGADKNSGAHKRYNPKDATDQQCMKTMKDVHEKVIQRKMNDVESKKLKTGTFQEICKRQG